MPIVFPLPEPWASRGWKLKIRDKERLEPPHVTVSDGKRTWRWNLRSQSFMDKKPPVGDVPPEVVDHIRERLPEIVGRWDGSYPENPVFRAEDADE